MRLFVDPKSPPENRTLIVAGGNSTSVWDGTDLHYIPGSEFYLGVWLRVRLGRQAGKTVLYAANEFAVKDGVLKGGGLLATEDGGKTWRSLNEGLLKICAPGTYPGFTTIGTSLRHPEVLYASVYHCTWPTIRISTSG